MYGLRCDIIVNSFSLVRFHWDRNRLVVQKMPIGQYILASEFSYGRVTRLNLGIYEL